MRNTSYEIQTIQIVDVLKKVNSEKQTIIIDDKESRIMTITVKRYDSNDDLIDTPVYTIVGENYDLLMSSSPYFAPNKPEDDSREEDRWFIIDKIRDEKNNQQ